MGEIIPKEELDAAHRKLCRRVASTIIAGMAEADVSFDVLDARLSHKPGFSKRFLNDLITAKTNILRVVSDLSYALGFEPKFSFTYPLRQHQEAPSATTEE